MIYVLLGIILVLAIWAISEYNFFASAKTRIAASIQEIGNQLKRQADLIPNLEESTKGYLKHEKGVFEMLTEARRSVAKASGSKDVNEMAKASSKLAEILPKIQILVEDNPELKASEVVGNLMDELRDTADKIMYARRLMIDLTADYNVKRVSFPSSIIAGVFNFGELKGFEATEEEKKQPKISL